MRCAPDAIIVIKATASVSYTKRIREQSGNRNIIFSPEFFLRESKALYDNLYPNRIIVGTDLEDGHLLKATHTFVDLLKKGTIKEDIATLIHGIH